MSDILVVGSVGLDDVETPRGKVTKAMGGSAIYFSYAASYFSNVNIVGVAGDDFPLTEMKEDLKKRPVNFDGFEIIEGGKTFRWSGKYKNNMNDRDTLLTELNVFETFNPVIPSNYNNKPILFLANIHPILQNSVLEKVNSPQLVITDTMDFWIEGNRAEVDKVLKKSDIVIINNSEAELLTTYSNFTKAAKIIMKESNLKALVIKLGKFGVYLTNGNEHFFLPAYPVDEVFDPTGAGDTFAGGFTGYLAKVEKYDFETLKKAIVYGSVIASYTVSAFSVNALKNISDKEIEDKYKEFKDFVSF